MRPGFVLKESSAPLATGEAISPAAHPAWRSPVPYLFGGIAAMLGLITFALLVLVCSYWKLSGYVDSAEHMSDTADSGDGGRDVGVTQGKQGTAMEERFVVVMAGDERKIFLAQPIRSRASFLTGGGGEEESPAAAKVEKGGGDCCEEMVKPDEAGNVLAGGESHDHV
ncbi:protein GLUTAMINE DUMPER 2-like [Phalaenopsis equestris]|uniref:protein GLUTAMINE DUMPER 2-like n=1 Tax=Phalaenopsis equestris TaxID=78828 RepID=UPI0009E1D064|nr:protein GLUTAMINE DUMPER 2-like [Phalaenopsis equestris]